MTISVYQVSSRYLIFRGKEKTYDITGKIFTGTDLNGQTVWLLDSRNVPIDIEFSTDSDIKGNRFTMEVAQEICGPLLS